MLKYRAPLPHFNCKSKFDKIYEENLNNGSFKRINNRKNNEIRDMCNFLKLKQKYITVDIIYNKKKK
ncbi:hypothetical protein PFMALIP_03586 [Plasmodium falciparum MaliPS096_E11]|uniref:Uncharacterized protein n=1 Tax=Plasmodium falciparum MaliPS096_E11 TaxID=1036727 RepID=A0A024WMI0_PLAFA|nr:hypothetical protein PFMALIP_03586 [Plasmodium falciparum MaliPS096_E11]